MEYELTTLTVQQMLIFVTVVEENGFAKAGEKMNMTQSAVSKSISRMEKAIELQLFIRSTRYLELTEAGKILYLSWKKQLSALQNSYLKAQYAQKQAKELLRIGLLNTARPDRYFYPLQQKFAKQHPEIVVRVESLYMYDLIGALVNDQYDLIFFPDFQRFALDEEMISWCYAAKEQARILISENHPLAAKEYLVTEDLKPYHFITMGQDTDDTYLKDLTERLAAYDITPEIAYRYRTAYDIRYLFQPDNAILLVDAFFDSPEGVTNCKCIPLTDQENGIICAWKKDNPSPSLAAFISLLS